MAALAGLAAGATAATRYDPVSALAGRYSDGYFVTRSDGTEGAGDDLVEIVPVDRTHAFVRLSLSPSENHRCTVAVVAAREGDALVYRGPADDAYIHGRPGVLTVRRHRAALVWDDHDSCRSECETQGLLRHGRLPWSSRTIADPVALRRSDDFRAAVSDWRASR